MIDERSKLFSIIANPNNKYAPKAANLLRCIQNFTNREIIILTNALETNNHLIHNFIVKSFIESSLPGVNFVPEFLKLLYHPSTICRNKALTYLEQWLSQNQLNSNIITKKIMQRLHFLAKTARPLNRTIARRILKKVDKTGARE